MLSIVSTPIGNLEDITLRAIRTLKEVDFIICEDTRVSKKLLNHYEIENELVSFHGNTDERKAKHIIDRIMAGESAALISDAGTPGISDPGYKLIQLALESEVTISPIPGSSAVLAALVGSGMHMHHFLYLGFLPVKKGRKTLLEKLKDKEYTAIIYESPHRILKTLSDLKDTFGDDHIACIARELTKIHETYHRGTLSELLERAPEKPLKGEMVIVF